MNPLLDARTQKRRYLIDMKIVRDDRNLRYYLSASQISSQDWIKWAPSHRGKMDDVGGTVVEIELPAVQDGLPLHIAYDAQR